VLGDRLVAKDPRNSEEISGEGPLLGTAADTHGPSESLTEATVSGGAWRTMSVFGSALMQLSASIFLARLLTPSEFGTMALVAIVVGFTNNLAFLGVGTALVQRRQINRDYVAAAWTLSLIGGLAGFGIVAACAPLLARLVGDPSISRVFVATSPILFLVGLRTCSLALLRRQMKFRQLMVVDLVSYGLGYALVAVSLALLGWGVWSLVTALLCQGVVACVAALSLSRHSTRLGLNAAAVRDIFHFAGGMTASGLASYLALNGDNFVVGRTLGTSALGLYTRAYYLMNLPLSYVLQVLSQVLLPAYSRAQADRTRMTRGYLMSVYLVFVIASPAMMSVLVTAPYLIRSLFGARWEGAILPLQVFAIFGAFRATYNLGGTIAQASGKPWSEFLRQVLYASLVVGGAAIGSRWGIVGVAWGTGFAITVMYVAMARLSHDLLGFPWRSFAGAHGTGLACGLLVLAMGMGANQVLLESHWPDLAVLICLLAVCFGTAVAAVSLLPRSWRPDGVERVVSVALRMAPRRLGNLLTTVLRITGPASQA